MDLSASIHTFVKTYFASIHLFIRCRRHRHRRLRLFASTYILNFWKILKFLCSLMIFLPMQCLVVFFIFFFNVCKINHLIILLLILIYFYVINGKFQMKIIIIKKREEKIPKVTQDSAKGNSMKRENFTWYTSSTFISRLAFNKLNLIFLSTPIFFLLWVVCTRKRKSEKEIIMM